MNQVESKTRVISHATDIRMDVFIDVMVEGKLELLALDGSPTLEELQGAWGQIMAEYVEAIGDNHHLELIAALKDVSLLTIQYQRVKMLIQVLSHVYVPEGVAQLRKLGFVVRYDPTDLGSYYRDLQRVYENSKTLLVKAEMREKDLQKIREKNQGKETTRGDFQMMLISLSEYAKYQVNPSEISAFQFATMMHRQQEYAAALEKSLEKQKGWQTKRN